MLAQQRETNESKTGVAATLPSPTPPRSASSPQVLYYTPAPYPVQLPTQGSRLPPATSITHILFKT